MLRGYCLRCREMLVLKSQGGGEGGSQAPDPLTCRKAALAEALHLRRGWGFGVMGHILYNIWVHLFLRGSEIYSRSW